LCASLLQSTKIITSSSPLRNRSFQQIDLVSTSNFHPAYVDVDLCPEPNRSVMYLECDPGFSFIEFRDKEKVKSCSGAAVVTYLGTIFFSFKLHRKSRYMTPSMVKKRTFWRKKMRKNNSLNRERDFEQKGRTLFPLKRGRQARGTATFQKRSVSFILKISFLLTQFTHRGC